MRQNSQLNYSKVNQSMVKVLDKDVSKWRYSCHPMSIFSHYFGMRLGTTYSLFPFKKHYTCQHKFGCLESLLRKSVKYAAFLLFAKSALNLLFGIDVGQEIGTLLRDNWDTARHWG